MFVFEICFLVLFQFDKKDRARYMLTKVTNDFYHRKHKVIKHMNFMSKLMELCPLHKQPKGLKTQCANLLETCFGVTPELLV